MAMPATKAFISSYGFIAVVAVGVALIAIVGGVLLFEAWVIRIVARGLFDRDLSIGLSVAVAVVLSFIGGGFGRAAKS